MNITREQLVQILTTAGVYRHGWQLVDTSFETVSEKFVLEAWGAWVSALPPELTFRDDLGIRRPRWLAEAFDCDNHALAFLGHVITGNGLKAIIQSIVRGGLAFGVIFYVARPRPRNAREGGHAIVWFVDHEGRFRVFEPADGVAYDLDQIERTSAWFGLAA